MYKGSERELQTQKSNVARTDLSERRDKAGRSKYDYTNEKMDTISGTRPNPLLRQMIVHD